MDIYYTGVGSRRVPDPIRQKMVELGRWLAHHGFTLRSGAADGSDAAFEEGCDAGGGNKEIWLPWPGFNGHNGQGAYLIPGSELAQYEAVAASLHPAWDRLTQGPRKLHSRNVGQVLGKQRSTPSAFEVCWTPDGCISAATRTRDTGGTATAIVLAEQYGIPRFNLHDPNALSRVYAFATRLVRQRDRRFHPEPGLPEKGEIFVFGANKAGRHGAGSALVARERFGAQYGVGEGPQGLSYGIPTKDGRPGTPDLRDPQATLPLIEVQGAVTRFIEYAKAHPELTFYVVRVGCSLACHSDSDVAPFFDEAPSNCIFSEAWKPWLGVPAPGSAAAQDLAPPINIWSGAPGLGGALTNMSERARQRGGIKHSYPVRVNGVHFADSEAAYQALKEPGQDAYNDGLMIDLIALKFKQNRKLFDYTTENGGAAWLLKCSHFTGAKSAKFQSWEGQGAGSRFIRNLVQGYLKAKTGLGPQTRVVHVKEAPYDVYIGRANGQLPESRLHNPWKVGEDGTLEQCVEKFHERLMASPDLIAAAQALKGKTLSCWCKSRGQLTRLCHGDVIAAVAEGRPWVTPTAVQQDLFA